MPKPTLQSRLVEALLKCGEGPVVDGKTSKAIVVKKKSGGFWFAGRSGSLRYGQCYSKSFPASDAYKERLLAGVMLTAKFVSPTIVYFFYSDGTITMKEKHPEFPYWRPSQKVKPEGAQFRFVDGKSVDMIGSAFQDWFEKNMLSGYRKVSL